MIGIVSSPEPFKVKDVVLAGAYDLYGRGRVSNFLRSFNLLNADVQTFTSNGTWTMPVGAKSINVVVIGGGGGGGSGRKGASGTIRCGGGGGGTGGISVLNFTAAELTPTVAISIG